MRRGNVFETTVSIRWINTLPPSELKEQLGRCCAASGWVRALTRTRPFADRAALDRASDAALAVLSRNDLLEALERHPRLGESATATAPVATEERDWSRREQSGIATAADPVKARLAALNKDYEQKFGWIFLLSATGLPGEEVVTHLERRLSADPESELATVGLEMAAIARRRLERLLIR